MRAFSIAPSLAPCTVARTCPPLINLNVGMAVISYFSEASLLMSTSTWSMKTTNRQQHRQTDTQSDKQTNNKSGYNMTQTWSKLWGANPLRT